MPVILGLAVFCLSLAVDVSFCTAQQANYDESKVPAYVLPDPLVSNSGKSVTTAEEWVGSRRAEVLRLFEDHVFGELPPITAQLRTRVRSDIPDAVGGLARRREITIYFSAADTGPQMDLLLYTPAAATGQVPCFLGLNFNGNQAIESDPRLHITQSWVRNDRERGIDNNRATEATRAPNPVAGPSKRSFAGDLVWRRSTTATSIRTSTMVSATAFMRCFRKISRVCGHRRPVARSVPGHGGSVAALDVLEKDPTIDGRRVAVFGHSRLGKTSLWAGAQDERFAMVISNNSGCGGAAISRRAFGETVARINRVFPHWFCVNHRKYDNNEQSLPVDHHMLMALAAPRPVYVASAVEDQWADPRGEYLGLFHAGPVYQLFGKSPLPSNNLPELNQPVQTDVGYHIRSGKHDVTEYDWEQYLAFAKRHLK
ncbi:MAG UNVERIFIED_CONTAM: acetylxylan esterase [Planctomycetaceae bacterium]